MCTAAAHSREMIERGEAERWAAQLDDARRTRTGCAPLSDSIDLDLGSAYTIQRALTARRLARGERVVGWKLGYTSLAMREQMGIDRPNFGPLTDAMLLADGDVGAVVSPELLQPRVEPEIAVRFVSSLAGTVTVDDVVGAMEAAYACLEVVDSVYPDYRFRIEDNTADGSSAAQVVVGPALSAVDALDRVAVVLRRNGGDVARATGAAASGHPLLGVVWLVEQLAAQGGELRAGDVVITGGLTHAVPLLAGDQVEAIFDGEARVSVRREPTR